MNASAPGVELPKLLEDYGVTQSPQLSVHGMSLDSRLVAAGDLYVALAGHDTHGLHYVNGAVAAGAVAVLADSHDLLDFKFTDLPVPVVGIASLRQRLGHIAARFFDHPSKKLTVVGITGTDGKTSVSQFVYQAMTAMGRDAGFIGTIGWGDARESEPNPLTTPDVISIQRMLHALVARGVETVAMEVSSHALDQYRLDGCRVRVAVLTNLGRDHLDYHGTLDAYRQAKQKLFDWPELEVAVLNVDDEFGLQLSNRLPASIKKITWALDSSAAISAHRIVSHPNGLSFTLKDADSDNDFEIHSGLIGRFNVSNLLAAYGVLQAVGAEPAEAANVLPLIKAVPGRMERFGSSAGPVAVVDYAHTPQALRAALESTRAHCKGKLSVVFGCGGDRDIGKRAKMGAIASQLADRIILTDDNPRTEPSQKILDDIAFGVTSHADLRVIGDRAQAIDTALDEAANDDWVLVAGKGHEDYQIVGQRRLVFSDRQRVASRLGDYAMPAEQNS